MAHCYADLVDVVDELQGAFVTPEGKQKSPIVLPASRRMVRPPSDLRWGEDDLNLTWDGKKNAALSITKRIVAGVERTLVIHVDGQEQFAFGVNADDGSAIVRSTADNESRRTRKMEPYVSTEMLYGQEMYPQNVRVTFRNGADRTGRVLEFSANNMYQTPVGETRVYPDFKHSMKFGSRDHPDRVLDTTPGLSHTRREELGVFVMEEVARLWHRKMRPGDLPMPNRSTDEHLVRTFPIRLVPQQLRVLIHQAILTHLPRK